MEGKTSLHVVGCPGYMQKTVSESDMVMFLQKKPYHDELEGIFAKIFVLHEGKICSTIIGEDESLEMYLRPVQ